MTDRNIICEFYEAKGHCAKGRDAEARGYCQKCRLYSPDPHARPFRYDNRRNKIYKITKKEQNDT